LNEFKIGDIALGRIDEICGPAVLLATHCSAACDTLLSNLRTDAIDRNASWLIPTFYDPASKMVRGQ
jgi:hypothetical protein